MSKPRKRKRSPFDLFGDDFERMFEEMERMMEEAFQSSFVDMGQPFVRGFSVRVDSNGKPHVQEFGNKPLRDPSGEPQISEEREPLTDVIEGEKIVAVTVEIPGVEKEDIDLEVMEDSLEINVDRPGRKYHKLLTLPCGVDPSSTKATYKNGVLDVEIQRKEKKTRKGYKIDIK
jgi:HSP20 family protein